jgi:predicted phosphodiesterase
MENAADPSPREELLQRRLTRARLALGALGMVVAVCAIAVGATIWYWISYLRGPSDTPFTRGPYLLRVTGSEAELRWRGRDRKPLRVTAVAADGAPVDVAGGVLRDLRPDTRYSWTASVDGTAHASGSFTTPPRTLDRPVRFAVLGDYGSGNDNEWAVGRVLAAQRPEFVVSAGDNSYLVAAEVLLDRNIFRPLADLIGSAPLYVCLGDHDNFWPGPGAISKAFDIPQGGRFAVRYGPIQVVILGDQANVPGAVAFARRALREPGPTVRFVVCHRPVHHGDPILAVVREGGASALFCGHLHRYERRTVDGVAAFTVGTGGQGPGSLAYTRATPGAAVSLLDIGALMVEVRTNRTVGYTFLDKHGSVLDHLVI